MILEMIEADPVNYEMTGADALMLANMFNTEGWQKVFVPKILDLKGIEYLQTLTNLTSDPHDKELATGAFAVVSDFLCLPKRVKELLSEESPKT